MFVVVLTGAGISKESGLSTFRDEDGVWAKFDPYELATPEAFASSPDRVHAFYNDRRAALPRVSPNPAHRALATLEETLISRGDEFLLITQNVDNLHQRAGSQNILQMHGAIDRITCTYCGQETEWTSELTKETPCSHCASKGGLRPAVVWFGEMPKYLDAIEEALAHTTHFIAIGTSGTVYPAAGLAAVAAEAGAKTLLINLEPAENNTLFDKYLYGPATEQVPRWVDQFLTSTQPL